MNKKFFSLSVKTSALFLILSICFSTYGAHKAQAVLGVGDVVFDPSVQMETSIGSAAGLTNAGTAATALSWTAVGENVLDAAAYAAAQQLLNQLTQNTIQWIKGGFHGSPSFAVDTKAIATRVADNIAGGLVLSLRNIAVCDFTLNYKDDLINTVDLSTSKQPYLYNQKATCPFRQDYNFKASDFYADFNNGLWKGFGAALNDSGNPYGVQLVTAQEQAARQAAAQADKDKQLSWSNGFANIVDTTDCNYPSDLFVIPNDPNDPGTGVFDDTKPVVTQAMADALNQNTWGDPQNAKDLQNLYCKTTTPGKIVGDQLTKTLGLDMDRIGFADNMNKIVAAFLDTLTQKTIRSVFGKGDTSISTGPIGGGLGGPAGTGAPIIGVTTSPATSVATSKTTWVLNGYITSAPASSNVQVWFILGKIGTGGTLLQVPIPSSNTGERFSTRVNSLEPDTAYFFNTIVTTGGTTPNPNSLLSGIHGAELTFRTEPL